MVKITAGLLSAAVPGWGLEEGKVTAFLREAEGRPDILVAQTICAAATSGAKVVMLLPRRREDDDVWGQVMQQLSGGSAKEGAAALMSLPLMVYAGDTGMDQVGDCELVYAPKLTRIQLRRVRGLTDAPIVVMEAEGANCMINVGTTRVVIADLGTEVPVSLDLSEPVYRSA